MEQMPPQPPEAPEAEDAGEGAPNDPKELITGVSSAMGVIADVISKMPDVPDDKKSAFSDLIGQYQSLVSDIFSGAPAQPKAMPMQAPVSQMGGPKGQPVG